MWADAAAAVGAVAADVQDHRHRLCGMWVPQTAGAVDIALGPSSGRQLAAGR